MENKYIEKLAFLRNPQQVFDTFTRRSQKAVTNAYAKSFVKGAIPGAVIGGSVPVKDAKDGKVHRVRNALTFGAAGGVMGGSMGLGNAVGKISDRGMRLAGEAFHRQRAAYGYSRSPSASVDDLLKHFGAKKSQFTTKAEASKHFKRHMQRAHPDREGGNEELFKKMNTAREHILKSEWFEKLAMENKYLEKIAIFGLIGGYAGSKNGDKLGGTLIGGTVGGIPGSAIGAVTGKLIGHHFGQAASESMMNAGSLAGALAGGALGGKLYSKVKKHLVSKD